jgi:hypothetical protein
MRIASPFTRTVVSNQRIKSKDWDLLSVTKSHNNVISKLNAKSDSNYRIIATINVPFVSVSIPIILPCITINEISKSVFPTGFQI